MYKLTILNWNIGGAKYLTKKARESKNRHPDDEPREEFRKRLNSVLGDLIRKAKPSIITLQEVVRYEADGIQERVEDVIVPPDDYDYLPKWLIDTQHHSHQGKWNKVREKGEWKPEAYFAQGNAILIRKTIPHFHIWRLPGVGDSADGFLDADPLEVVKLESGLYFGDRNTEPRAALVTHLVLSGELSDQRRERLTLTRPMDIFVINLHLTTLMMEREGVPEIDEEAAQTRLRQLDLVLNGIVSRYNKWRKQGYPIRGKDVKNLERERENRHAPIWVIAGDFNFTPESVEYQTMVRRGFIDLIPSHPLRLGTKASGLGNDPTLTLDYVFAGPRFEAIDPFVAEKAISENRVIVDEDTKVSDHFPLIVGVPIALEKP